MLDVDALVHALRACDLRVEAVPVFGDWACILQVDLVEGLPGALMIRPAGADALEAAFTCSVTADVGTRRAEVEELLSSVDHAALPARLFLFRDELGLAVHGACREPDLEALALEFVLIARRICTHVLAPVVAYLDGSATRKETNALLELLAVPASKGEI
jgi:hypothetical protein